MKLFITWESLAEGGKNNKYRKLWHHWTVYIFFCLVLVVFSILTGFCEPTSISKIWNVLGLIGLFLATVVNPKSCEVKL